MPSSTKEAVCAAAAASAPVAAAARETKRNTPECDEQ